jgi:hypothetical protein
MPLQLEDHDFTIPRTKDWKLVTTTNGVKLWENPTKDVWELADGDFKGCQKFTWDAAIRETKKAGKRMPTDEEFRELVKTKGDVKNLRYSGYRGTSGSYGNRSGSDYLWSSTALDGSSAWLRNFYYSMDSVGRGTDGKADGFSVRCLQDSVDSSVSSALSKKVSAVWTDTTPKVDNRLSLTIGSRSAVIHHYGEKFLRCELNLKGEYSKDDWAFLEKVARKIRSFNS